MDWYNIFTNKDLAIAVAGHFGSAVSRFLGTTFAESGLRSKFGGEADAF